MTYQATVVEIFIASPSDVLSECDRVRSAIAAWNATNSRERGIVLTPVSWTTHSSPEMGGRPQEMLNDRLLKHADVLIGIFWSMVGTPTGNSVSGTIEEIQLHRTANKPVMLYFKTAAIPQKQIVDAQRAKLAEFREWAKPLGIWHEFENADQLDYMLQHHLPRMLAANPGILQRGQHEPEGRPLSAAVPMPSPSGVRSDGILSQEAVHLLLSASKGNGTVTVSQYISGTAISAGGKNYTEDASPREVAKWREAVSELMSVRFLEDRSGKGSVFQLTGRGWSASDKAQL